MAGPGIDALAEAETVAARALLFLASDEARLLSLLESSGLTPDALRQGAGSLAVQSGVLGHLLADESLLLVFSAETALQPEQVAVAAAVLDGRPVGHDAMARLKPRREPKPGRGFR